MSINKTTTQASNITLIQEIKTPRELIKNYPLSIKAKQTVTKGRADIQNILKGEDDRLLVVVGPCSIHSSEEALEYARKIKMAGNVLSKDLVIVMRTYFEKPRTTTGWKGLINDPDLNDSFNINKGLEKARKLLLDISNLGVPTATEFLDTYSPKYIPDLISWGAVGARTTESQIHRELASSLPCPIGFKNGTDGGMQVAIDAMMAAESEHHYISMSATGAPAVYKSKGNKACHIILRGGNGQPNYDQDSVSKVIDRLSQVKMNTRLMIDCNHGNSNKNHLQQIEVCKNVTRQVQEGNNSIFGLMIESNLVAGSQDINNKPLAYGQSITDACTGWDDTEGLLKNLALSVRMRREENAKSHSQSLTVAA